MALLIYKQWHRSPNKKGTPHSNALHIKYIGERVHVLKHGEAENGLFGKFCGGYSDKISLTKAQKYVRALSECKKTIFRSCISFTPERAKMLGLEDDFKAWQKFVRYHTFSLAKNNGIGLKDFEYLAAVHLKDGQPHVHIVFWDKNQEVGKSFVDPQRCDMIRKELQTKAFGEIAEEMNIDGIEEEWLADDFVLDNGDKVRKTLISLIFADERKAYLEEQNAQSADFVNLSKTAEERIAVFPELSQMLEKITESVPPKGRLSYGYMPEDIKRELDKMSDKMMEIFPELRELFDGYLETKQRLAEMYNSTETPCGRLQTATAVGKAKDGLYKKLGNKILRVVSAQRLELRRAELERKQEHNREVFKNRQFTDLTSSVCRLLLREFTASRSETEAAGAGKAKGNTDLSKEARREIIFENKDKEREF